MAKKTSARDIISKANSAQLDNYIKRSLTPKKQEQQLAPAIQNAGTSALLNSLGLPSAKAISPANEHTNTLSLMNKLGMPSVYQNMDTLPEIAAIQQTQNTINSLNAANNTLSAHGGLLPSGGADLFSMAKETKAKSGYTSDKLYGAYAGEKFAGGAGKGVSNMVSGLADISAYAMRHNNSPMVRWNEEHGVGSEKMLETVRDSGIIKGVNDYASGIDARYNNPTGAAALGGEVSDIIGGMAPEAAAAILLGNVAAGAGVAAKGVSLAQKAASLAALGLSAGGGAAAEARNDTEARNGKGATEDESFYYGLGSGAVEVGTELLGGGIPIPGLNSGLLDDFVDKGLTRLGLGKATKAVLNRAADVIGEGNEEVLSEFASPFLQRVYKDDDRSVLQTLADTAPDAKHAWLMGALTSGVMNAGTDVGAGVNNFLLNSNNAANAQSGQTDGAVQTQPNVQSGAGTDAAQGVHAGQATTIYKPYQGVKPTERANASYDVTEVSQADFETAQNKIAEFKADDTTGFKKAIKEFYKSAVGGLFGGKAVTVKNAEFDGGNYDVTLNTNVIEKVVSDKNISAGKLAVLNNINAIVENGKYVGSGEYNKASGKNVTRYDYFETDATIAGEPYVIAFDVEVIPGTNKYRTHKTINKMSLMPFQGVETSPALAAPRNTLSSIPIIADDAQNATPVQNNAQGFELPRVNNVQPEVLQEVLDARRENAENGQQAKPLPTDAYGMPIVQSESTQQTAAQIQKLRDSQAELNAIENAARQVNSAAQTQQNTVQTQQNTQNTAQNAQTVQVNGKLNINTNASSVDMDAEGHTAEQQNTIAEYKNAVNPQIVEFVNKVDRGEYVKPLDIGKTDERATADIKRETGVDVDGYTYAITQSGIKHIEKRHGANGLADKSMANVEDIARVKWVLENYDSVSREQDVNGKYHFSNEYKSSDGTHAQTVVFSKAIDGTYYVVEAVPDSKAKKIQLISAYISKNNAVNKKGTYQVRDTEAPRRTAKTELELVPNTIIPNTAQNASPAQNVTKSNKTVSTDTVKAEPTEIKAENYTEKQSKAVETGKKLGVNVRVLRGMDAGVNGMYKNGVLYLSDDMVRQSVNPELTVLRHELTHHLEGTKEYTQLKNYLFNDGIIERALKAENADATLDTYRTFTKQMYERQGIQLDAEGVDAEIMAKYVEDNLFTDQKSINALAARNGNVAQKIWQWLKDTLKNLTTPNAATRQLQQAERMYAKALAEANKQNGNNAERYSYIGENANLSKEQQSTLDTAKQLEEQGKDGEAIRQQTGWHIGSDGKWRFEIDDSKTRYYKNGDAKGTKNGEVKTLGDYFDAPDLYKAYPALENVSVEFDDLTDNVAGFYRKRADTIILNTNENADRRATLLHEMQHIVQGYEEFARGSNANVARAELFAEAYENVKDTAEFKQLGTAEQRRKFIQNLVENDIEANYANAAGEVEARDVVNRMNYTTSQRMITTPDTSGNVVSPATAKQKYIDALKKIGYSEVEAKNIAGGKNSDGSARNSVGLMQSTDSDSLGRRYNRLDVSGSRNNMESKQTPVSNSGLRGRADSGSDSTKQGVTASKVNYSIAGLAVKPDSEYGLGLKKVADHKANNAAKNAVKKNTDAPKPLKGESKATRVQTHRENNFVNAVGEELSVPGGARREYLRPIAKEMSEEIQKNGHVSEETANRLFDMAWKQGLVIDSEFYDQYKGLKQELKGITLTLDKSSRYSQEYDDMQKRYRYDLNIKNEGGTPVDMLYQELCALHPELFDEEIAAPLDQLERIGEVAKSITTMESTLDAYHGKYVDDFRESARYKFDNAVAKLEADIKGVEVYRAEKAAEAQAKTDAAKTVPDIDTDMARELYKEKKELEKQITRIMNNALFTEHDKAVIDALLSGAMTPDMVTGNNKADIMSIYKAKKNLQDAMKPITEHNKDVAASLKARAEELIKNSDVWKDKSHGIEYSTETMERNMRDIIKDKGEANAIIKEYFTPVHKNEAKATNFKNEYRSKIAALKLNQNESEYLQIYGELRGTEAAMKMGYKRSPSELAALQGAADKYLKDNHGKIDTDKITAALPVFNKAYDEMYAAINDALIKNGYAPFEYRSGYFPHFQDEKPDTLVQKIAAKVGVGVQGDGLPTNLAGLTYSFRPGRRYNPYANQRMGTKTAFDAVKGFDNYIDVAADIIYHTEDIRKLRAFEDAIRFKNSEKGTQEEIESIRNNETLTEEQKETQIDAVREKSKCHLTNLVQVINEYTNKLAGKKSAGDRWAEKELGRGMYQVMSSLENRVAANMVAINPGSWLTNVIPIVQATGECSTGSLLRAAKETVQNYFRDDGFTNKSAFLINRRGSDRLAMTTTRKISNMLSKPMTYIDEFSSDVVTRAKYLDNIKAGLSDDAAMDNADAYAAGVIADRSKGALPTFFENKNPLVKLVTMYQVEANNTLRYLLKDYPKVIRDKGVMLFVAGLLKMMFASYLYNDLFEKLTGRRPAQDVFGIANETVGAATGYQMPNALDMANSFINKQSISFENGKEGSARNAIKTFGKAVADEIPFVGGLIGGGRLPINSAIPDVPKIADNAIGLISGETNSAYAVQNIVKEAAKPAFYMLPSFGGGQLKKVIEGVSTVANGGEYAYDNKGRLQQKYALENTNAGTLLQAALFGRYSLPEAQEYVNSGFKDESVKYTAAYKEAKASGMDGTTFKNIWASMDANGDGTAGMTESLPAIRSADVTEEQRTMLWRAVASDAKLEKYDKAEKEGYGTQYVDAVLTADANGNGSLTKDEIQAYLNKAIKDAAAKRLLFDLLKANASTENPY